MKKMYVSPTVTVVSELTQRFCADILDLSGFFNQDTVTDPFGEEE